MVTPAKETTEAPSSEKNAITNNTESTKSDSKTSNKPATESTPDHADALQAAEFIKKKPQTIVVDVRTPDEFATGHIKGAINVDFKGADFEAEVKKLDPSKTYLIHCRSGGRSTSSLGTFSKLGFHHVIHLDGGMMGWGKEQLPIEK